MRRQRTMARRIFKMFDAMKKFFLPIAIVAAVAVSCGRDQIEIDPTPAEYVYTFTIDEDDTRALLDNQGVLWTSGDRVGMYLEGYTGYANVQASASPKTIQLYSKQEIPAGSYAYAYYPYDTSNNDKTNTIINIPNLQSGGSTSAMPMAGIPFLVQERVEVNGSSATSNGVIQFVNLGAIIDFRVFSTNASYRSETVQYVTFQANGSNVAGKAYLDLMALSDGQFDDDALNLSWGSADVYDNVKVTQTVAVASAKDAAIPIYMVVAPGTFASGTITVVTDAATYTFDYTNKELGRNMLKHYNMDLAHASRVAGVTEVVMSTPYEETFASNMGEFTTDGVQVASNNVWKHDSYGYMKANAYYNSTRYACESWLTSPWIDLRSATSAKVSFDHVYRYDSGYAERLTLWVQTDASSSWTQVTIPTYSSGSNWTFVNSGDISLDAFVGHKVKVGFKYVATSTIAATWEVKNFVCTSTSTPIVRLGWLELPSYTTSSMSGTTSSSLNDLYKVTHKATMGGTLQRNYTVLYDPAMYASYWVAYPLCSSHLGSGRTDDPWDYDPQVPSSKQATVFPTSYGQYFASASNIDNLYARGHQIPNADRNGCEEMRVQTFYMTNITPQVHYGLNSGTWSDLEGAVRDVIKYTSDTLYVVTGAAFRKKGTSDTINTFYFNKNGDSKTIPIPNYYWKALLKVKWSGTTVTSAKAIGFWLPNEDLESVDYSGFTVSIDDLEQWTGFDLFANLPDSVESGAETNTSWSQFQSF